MYFCNHINASIQKCQANLIQNIRFRLPAGPAKASGGLQIMTNQTGYIVYATDSVGTALG